jgi:hypothetical protein
MLSWWKRFCERAGEKRLILVIAAFSFVVQIAVLREPIIYGEPYLIAKNIVAGKGYVFTYPLTGIEAVTCYATPLYTYIQAAILGAGLGERGIQIFNLLALQAACLVIYRLLRRFARVELAIPAFFALVMYPPLWILGYALDPNTLNVLLLTLTLDRLLSIAVAPTKKHWVLLGVLVGVQLLLRPDILLGITLFAAWLGWVRRRELLPVVKGLALAATIALAIVAPWTARNYIVFHKFVLVSANAGFNLYVGNNPGATGEFAEVPDASPEVEQNYHEFLAFSKTHDQVEMDQFRYRSAANWILSHPIEVMRLDARKLWYHWFGREELGTQYHYAHGAFSTLYKAIAVLLLLLASYALYLLRDRKLRLLFVTLALYSSLISVIFFVQSRHRTLKIDPFMVPLATIGLLKLVARRQESAAPFTLQIVE